jgi:hypothetical protein
MRRASISRRSLSFEDFYDSFQPMVDGDDSHDYYEEKNKCQNKFHPVVLIT